MTTIIHQGAGFTRRVSVEPIKAQKGSFHVAFTTAYADSRHPDEFRNELNFTTNREGLDALGKEIYTAIVNETGYF